MSAIRITVSPTRLLTCGYKRLPMSEARRCQRGKNSRTERPHRCPYKATSNRVTEPARMSLPYGKETRPPQHRLHKVREGKRHKIETWETRLPTDRGSLWLLIGTMRYLRWHLVSCQRTDHPQSGEDKLFIRQDFIICNSFSFVMQIWLKVTTHKAYIDGKRYLLFNKIISCYPAFF